MTKSNRAKKTCQTEKGGQLPIVAADQTKPEEGSRATRIKAYFGRAEQCVLRTQRQQLEGT